MENRLKQLRKQNGISLKKLSQKLNDLYGVTISDSQLSYYENGKRSPRDESIWKYIATFFDVPVGYLLGYQDDIDLIMNGTNEEQKVFDSRSSPYLQKNLNFLKDIEEVKKIKTDTLVAIEFVENIFSRLSQYGRVKPGSYASEINHISLALLDFLSDLERVEDSLQE
ncbi:helix-turn-helix transcriptional regulator [Streptococcus suis]|uniref:helix-turn-helix domain-containing protein n=1 Tax=Streptococcus suis TaxID=1307 RepID=UPI0005CDDE9B|nr:helix-turn-helix transcriptional regulator [Streptococcus suis]NQP66592.1 helix-turn-helix transcriptional regulator [Streptococcus suis]NQR00294.1 helix-turn-helix transcriptional regulator [Streptococcus suis]NQR91365.1 helix-turn-helix transcriptional regulator [Streptococcus suis]CYX69073.1 XRE family transcriptional regulator [Streptococcus suis]HEM5494060.1 helix-turn-helix transcriptional regulator [Streptococcus suis]